MIIVTAHTAFPEGPPTSLNDAARNGQPLIRSGNGAPISLKDYVDITDDLGRDMRHPRIETGLVSDGEADVHTSGAGPRGWFSNTARDVIF